MTPATAPSGRPRRRRIGQTVVASIAIALVVLSVAVWAVFLRSVSGIPAGMQVVIDIPRGADTHSIATRLAAAGVVANADMFRVRSRMDGADAKLRPGTYEFETGTDYETVIVRLTQGAPFVYDTVTIPEGFTIDQIAERLQAHTGIKAADFKRLAGTRAGVAAFKKKHGFLVGDPAPTLEGYLFPKTYRIDKGSSATEAIDIMLSQFGKETGSLDLTAARAKGLTLHQVVTIASMIERETLLEKERPLVSSVIYNRLARGMRLEIDATVQYIVGNKRRLLYRDLHAESPYNTYLHTGLPPGGIASPGSAALDAAAHPAPTGYLYYVLTGRNGSHTFLTNKADFLRAKQQAKGGLR